MTNLVSQTRPPKGGRWHFKHSDGTDFYHGNVAELTRLVQAHDRKEGRPETSELEIENQLAAHHPSMVGPAGRRTNAALPTPPVEPEQRWTITVRGVQSKLDGVLQAVKANQFVVESTKPA